MRHHHVKITILVIVFAAVSSHVLIKILNRPPRYVLAEKVGDVEVSKDPVWWRDHLLSDDGYSFFLGQYDSLRRGDVQSFMIRQVVTFDTATSKMLTIDHPDQSGKWVLNGKVLVPKNGNQDSKKREDHKPAQNDYPQNLEIRTYAGIQRFNTDSKNEKDTEKEIPKHELFTVDGIRFEDGSGTQVYPETGSKIYGPTRFGLYVITKDHWRIEIFSGKYGYHGFCYDPGKKRLLVQGGPGTELYIFDIYKNRGYSPNFDAEGRHYYSDYFLVPGKDLLVLHRVETDEYGHNECGSSLHICDMSGRILQDLPEAPEYSMQVMVSKHLIAYPLEHKKKPTIRFYRITKDGAQY